MISELLDTRTEPARPAPAARRAVGATVATALSCAVATAAAGWAATGLAGNQKAPWILGRAAGLTAYVLLTALVCTGLFLAHPAAARFRRPHPLLRLRLHAGLAAFTLAFLVLHVVVLATDRYAGVGWTGSVVPLASTYRPVPVTLGVLGLYSGVSQAAPPHSPGGSADGSGGPSTGSPRSASGSSGSTACSPAATAPCFGRCTRARARSSSPWPWPAGPPAAGWSARDRPRPRCAAPRPAASRRRRPCSTLRCTSPPSTGRSPAPSRASGSTCAGTVPVRSRRPACSTGCRTTP